MSGPRLCWPREDAPRKVRKPTARRQGDDFADDGEDLREPAAPKGPRQVASIVLHSLDRILQVVCTEYKVTLQWLRRPENHKSEAFRVAVFLLVYDGERVQYSDIVSVLRIKLRREQSSSYAVQRIYQNVKAELGLARERIGRIEAIRRVLYFGSRDDKREPPRSIAGLLGQPSPLRPAVVPDAASRRPRHKAARPTNGVLARERADRVVALLEARGQLGSQAVRSELKVSYQIVLRVLQDLVKAHRVIATGARKLRRYGLARAA